MSGGVPGGGVGVRVVWRVDAHRPGRGGLLVRVRGWDRVIGVVDLQSGEAGGREVGV